MSFCWRGGGPLQGNSDLSVTQRGWNVIKAPRLGVGWSARIDPGVTRRQRLNGGPKMKEPNVER